MYISLHTKPSKVLINVAHSTNSAMLNILNSFIESRLLSLS